MRTDVVALEGELKKRETIKDQILAMCPELAEDDQALMDTLDGETNVDEILVAMARAVKEREAAAEACKKLVTTYKARVDRHESVAESLRKAIIWGMERAGKAKLKHAHVSLSWRPLEDKVQIVSKEPEIAPPEYVSEKTVKFFDPEKISLFLQEAIDDGIVVIHSDRKSLTIKI